MFTYEMTAPTRGRRQHYQSYFLTPAPRTSTAPRKSGRLWSALTGWRRGVTAAAADRSERQSGALSLAVGPAVAPRVRDLLTAVPLESGEVVSQQRLLAQQAFFVLEGRLAITEADGPVAVLGPGSFHGETDATTAFREDLPRLHALGDVVLGVAGPRELPEIHRLVPELSLLTHRSLEPDVDALTWRDDVADQAVEDGSDGDLHEVADLELVENSSV
jgi:hypothetical protein